MPERLFTPLIVIALLLGTLLALRSTNSSSVTPVPVSSVAALTPDTVPLVTGDEPITEIFTRAGCAVCHTDPAYRGHAKTVHDYVIESVIDPGVFVVPGYPAGTMPIWYGAKLSALALEKIAAYLERQGVTVTLPRFYRHLHKGENGEIGGDHASKTSTSVYRGL